MPRTGGGDTLMTKASSTLANFLLSSRLILSALRPSLARSSNGASGLKITAAFGALVKVAPSSPTIGTVWATPGVPSTSLLTRKATSSVRASEAPGGSWMMLMR